MKDYTPKFNIGDKVKIEGVIESMHDQGRQVHISTKGCETNFQVCVRRLDLVEAAPEPVEVGQVWRDKANHEYKTLAVFDDYAVLQSLTRPLTNPFVHKKAFIRLWMKRVSA